MFFWFHGLCVLCSYACTFSSSLPPLHPVSLSCPDSLLLFLAIPDYSFKAEVLNLCGFDLFELEQPFYRDHISDALCIKYLHHDL